MYSLKYEELLNYFGTSLDDFVKSKTLALQAQKLIDYKEVT